MPSQWHFDANMMKTLFWVKPVTLIMTARRLFYQGLVGQGINNEKLGLFL
jgi:hypothetical protein